MTLKEFDEFLRGLDDWELEHIAVMTSDENVRRNNKKARELKGE